MISGKIREVDQFVMGGFEIESKVPAIEAYRLFPGLRLQRREDGQLTGNNGKAHTCRSNLKPHNVIPAVHVNGFASDGGAEV